MHNVSTTIAITMNGRAELLETKVEKVRDANGKTNVATALVQPLMGNRAKRAQRSTTMQTSPRTRCTSRSRHQCRRRGAQTDMCTINGLPKETVVAAVDRKGNERRRPSVATSRPIARSRGTQGSQRRSQSKRCRRCRKMWTPRRGRSKRAQAKRTKESGQGDLSTPFLFENREHPSVGIVF